MPESTIIDDSPPPHMVPCMSDKNDSLLGSVLESRVDGFWNGNVKGIVKMAMATITNLTSLN